MLSLMYDTRFIVFKDSHCSPREKFIDSPCESSHYKRFERKQLPFIVTRDLLNRNVLLAGRPLFLSYSCTNIEFLFFWANNGCTYSCWSESCYFYRQFLLLSHGDEASTKFRLSSKMQFCCFTFYLPSSTSQVF